MLENSLDNVIILAQLFQQTDFSDRSAWHTFIFCFKTNLLEGDNVARVDVFGLVHHTIGACFFLVIKDQFGEGENGHTFSDLFDLLIVVKRHGFFSIVGVESGGEAVGCVVLYTEFHASKLS